MEAPFLPPVSAGLFWCLVFAVCPRRASSCRASQVFGIEDQSGRPANQMSLWFEPATKSPTFKAGLLHFSLANNYFAGVIFAT